MPWQVIERKIGRAGGVKQRADRQREWDQKYGEGTWAVGYVLDGEFVLQEDALESIYYQSYEEHFAAHPADQEELIRLAKRLRNPHAEATTEVDLQVLAIMKYLERHTIRAYSSGSSSSAGTKGCKISFFPRATSSANRRTDHSQVSPYCLQFSSQMDRSRAMRRSASRLSVPRLKRCCLRSSSVPKFHPRYGR